MKPASLATAWLLAAATAPALAGPEAAPVAVPEAPAPTPPADLAQRPLFPARAGVVAAVVETELAAVVVLDAGIGAGLRRGMLLRVDRGGDAVGTIQLVAVAEHRSAGLITDLTTGRTIAEGDLARVRTVKL